MDAVNTTDIFSRYQVPRHRLTRRDYHRMAEAGILGEVDRVELLEGQLIKLPAISPRHALAVDALNELLVFAAAGQAVVRVQNPVVLDDISEPQPDFALLRRPWDGYPHDHPPPADMSGILQVEALPRVTIPVARIFL